MNRSASIVRVDRRRTFSSDTLSDAARRELEAAFRSVSWWRDRWRDRRFHDAARRIAVEHGGLAVVGPGMSFAIPPPFHEQFEPIEIGRGFGVERARLETLSGSTPTRQEWAVKYILAPLGVIALLGGVVLMFHFHFRAPRQIIFIVIACVLAACIPFLAVVLARTLRSRWYLLPGAIAILRRPARRGQPARVTVLSHEDTCLALRYVQAGKTSVLTLELWTHLRRVYRRSVTDREAMSALAAWQSRLTPPPEEQLHDLALP